MTTQFDYLELKTFQLLKSKNYSLNKKTQIGNSLLFIFSNFKNAMPSDENTLKQFMDITFSIETDDESLSLIKEAYDKYFPLSIEIIETLLSLKIDPIKETYLIEDYLKNFNPKTSIEFLIKHQLENDPHSFYFVQENEISWSNDTEFLKQHDVSNFFNEIDELTDSSISIEDIIIPIFLERYKKTNDLVFHAKIPLLNTQKEEVFETVKEDENIPQEKPQKVYNTALIIETIKEYLFDKNASSYEEWQQIFKEEENNIKNLFPENVWSIFPLKDSVIKLIIKEITGTMFFDKEYVLKNYESSKGNKKFVLYPASDAKKMIVHFSNFSNSYNRFSWYWDETEEWNTDTVHLFLNDEENLWYLGKEGSETINSYKEIINYAKEFFSLSNENVYSVGFGMGGYGAIYYAYELGLKGAISVSPQLSKESFSFYKKDNWTEKMKETGNNFIDLQEKVLRHETAPFIYLEHNESVGDNAGTQRFIKSVRSKDSLLIAKRVKETEDFILKPSKETIEEIISFWEKQSI